MEDTKNPLLQNFQVSHEESAAMPNSNDDRIDSRNSRDNFVPSKTDMIAQSKPYSEEPEEADPITFERIKEVYAMIFVPSFSVMFTFLVTIGVFPALVVLIQSTESCDSSDRIHNDLFVPLLFLLFNLFDLIGRVTAGATKSFLTTKNIWIASLARIVFIPLFLLCDVSNSELPVVFNSDACPIIFMMMMATTNGYIASCSMMMGASVVPVKESALAGTIMIFSLTFGLLMGASISFIIVYISQGSL